MRYYFFKTELIDRGRGNGPENTLRALPGQTFPDGTPVDVTLNVHSPKEAGSSSNGSRYDYPIGTVFCSSFLKEITTSTGTRYYGVYDTEAGQGPNKDDPDFHPVTDDIGNFPYVSPSHRSDRMNAAWILFSATGEQSDGDAPAQQAAPRQGVRYAPADNKGKAVGPIAGWAPFYEDQVETESNLAVSWMQQVLRDAGIRTMARRPKLDDENRKKLDTLLSCGETIDTIASRARYGLLFAREKMDTAGIQSISKGPFAWYLDLLLDEHARGLDCTAAERPASDPAEVKDVAFLIATELNRQNGTFDRSDDPAVLADVKAALEKGWTLDDVIVPETLLSRDGIATLAHDLATGAIPLPEKKKGRAGKSFIDTVMKNPKFARPNAKGGFHVDEKTWKLLCWCLSRRRSTILLGPTGCGKTEVVRRLCEQTGTPFTLIPMGTITDPTEQLVGKMDLDPSTNGTKFDWADFALAIQRPGVVLLDEINRIPRNGENILFSVLDGTRTLVASNAKSTDKRTIQVNPECVFFATANMGAAYTGTKDIDLALLNRFLPIELDYLDTKTETDVLMAVHGIPKEDANNISIVAANVRKNCRNGTIQHSVSTRETIMCAELVKDGFDTEEALEAVFLPLFEQGITDNDTNCERGTVKAMIAKRMNNS